MFLDAAFRFSLFAVRFSLFPLVRFSRLSAFLACPLFSLVRFSRFNPSSFLVGCSVFDILFNRNEREEGAKGAKEGSIHHRLTQMTVVRRLCLRTDKWQALPA